MSEQPLSEKESLDLITSMIGRAKQNYQKGGAFQFLLWGWVIMLANLSHYYLEAFTKYDMPYVVWLITFPAGIVSGIYGTRLAKRALVTTHMDKMYGQVWIAAGVGIAISLVFMGRLGYNQNAVILLFAGMATYISGHLLRFRPLIFGGVALAIGSIIAFNVDITNQYLVAGIAIFIGYIIPGYLLKNKENG